MSIAVISESIYEILNVLETSAATNDNLNGLLMGKLMHIKTFNESYWEQVSWTVDPLSYYFSKRLFPCPGDDVVAPRPQQKKNGGGNKTAVEKIQDIKNQYDLRGTLRASLNAQYVDESRSGGRTSMETYTYYQMVSQDIITAIIDLSIRTRRLYAFALAFYCMIVSTREFCHMAFHHTVTNLMFDDEKYIHIGTDQHVSRRNPFTSDYVEIIHYALFYGNYLMYREECITRSYVTPKSRFLVDLEAAHRLPSFNGHLTANPYCPISLSAEQMMGSKIPSDQYFVRPIRADGHKRGLYSLPEFEERFAIFTDHLFTGLNMDGMWFGGSTITACLIKNPLEGLFGIQQWSGPIPSRVYSDDPDFELRSSEICRLRAFWNAQSVALKAYFNEYYPSKSAMRESISNEHQYCTQLSDIDIMIDDASDRRYDSIVDRVFKHIAAQKSGTKLLKIDTGKSYKYSIYGPNLERNIEIFRTFCTHPAGCVSRFHFPAVRGLYNGYKVMLFPSLISFAFSGIFMDYKWMSSTRESRELTLKYYVRGGVPLLNEAEHRLIGEYITQNEKWAIIKRAAEPYFRTVGQSNPIFRPRQYRHAFYFEQCLKSPDGPYDQPIEVPEAESRPIKSRFGFDMDFRYPSGHLQPLAFWKVMPYCDALARSKTFGGA